MNVAARAAKLESLIKVPIITFTDQLDDVRKAKRAALAADAKANVAPLSVLEAILQGVLAGLTSAKAQIEDLK